MSWEKYSTSTLLAVVSLGLVYAAIAPNLATGVRIAAFAALVVIIPLQVLGWLAKLRKRQHDR